jgi:TatA/E family protein of Tat protein translocase
VPELAATFWFVRPRVTIVHLEGAFPNVQVERDVEKVGLLILESLGSTELLFILVMALVFFGPRKLPQLSRSLGKNLAEFRKASEDFKRTWEKEVSLEESDARAVANDTALPEENSILNNEKAARPLQPKMIEAVRPDQVIARQAAGVERLSADKTGLSSDQSEFDGVTEETRHTPKQDWL